MEHCILAWRAFHHDKRSGQHPDAGPLPSVAMAIPGFRRPV